MIMAITDTLTAIKSYFFAWHENYYDQIHKEAINQVSEDPADDNKLVTNKGIRDYIQNVINPIKTKVGASNVDAFSKNNLVDAVNAIGSAWKPVSLTQNGYMTSSQWMEYKKRTQVFSYSFTARGGTITFRRQGMMGICYISGCKIPKGLDTNRAYVLATVPVSRNGTETNSNYTTLDTTSGLAGIYKPRATYYGSSSYDEVKWLTVRNFDSYAPAKGSEILKIDKTALTSTTGPSTYPRGAIVFKPLDNKNERTLYGSIPYWLSRYPTNTDIQKVS